LASASEAWDEFSRSVLDSSSRLVAFFRALAASASPLLWAPS